MAHNQYQYYQAISKQGVKLRQCSCSRFHFPVVEYVKGKSVRIYCQWGCGIVTLEKQEGVTEEEFVLAAAINWNTGRWDK